ncbi:MAG: ATP-binding protein [Fidelibacterota bacterium]
MKRHASASLIDWRRSSPRKPLILRGARQVGKTYLLREFGREQFPQWHYVNFEEDRRVRQIFERDLRPERIVNELQLYLNKKISPDTDLVIFDEIQHCPRALTSLKYFSEQMPQLALCSAGSLLGITLNTESFPVGKVSFLDMFPLTFTEFLQGTEENLLYDALSRSALKKPLPDIAHERLWELWKWYLITGGLPEVVATFNLSKDNLFEAFQSVRKLQKDLIDTYLADIAKHSGKINAMHIERLWRNVPSQLASTLDGSAPKFRFKDAVPGYRGYRQLSGPLEWLESTGLLLRTFIVKKAEIPLASFRKENWFKLYFFDVGILSAMSDLTPQTILDYDFHRFKGYVAENFVAQELRAIGLSDLYCWQGRTSEVDFLLETPRGIIPIEVKSGQLTQSKSLKVFTEKYSPYRSVVVSGRNVSHIGRTQRYNLPIYSMAILLSKVTQ